MSSDLQHLLKHLQPRLHPGEYVFCSLLEPDTSLRAHAICTFEEPEGTTVILPKDSADDVGLTYDYVAAWITLEVHSALDAVGLTAAFSTALAGEGISCNVVAGYYHDHIFVDRQMAEKAMDVLRALSNP